LLAEQPARIALWVPRREADVHVRHRLAALAAAVLEDIHADVLRRCVGQALG
jgi:hypothetical protein